RAVSGPVPPGPYGHLAAVCAPVIKLTSAGPVPAMPARHQRMRQASCSRPRQAPAPPREQQRAAGVTGAGHRLRHPPGPAHSLCFGLDALAAAVAIVTVIADLMAARDR